jgi:hypothetical protein
VAVAHDPQVRECQLGGGESVEPERAARFDLDTGESLVVDVHAQQDDAVRAVRAVHVRVLAAHQRAGEFIVALEEGGSCQRASVSVVDESFDGDGHAAPLQVDALRPRALYESLGTYGART